MYLNYTSCESFFWAGTMFSRVCFVPCLVFWGFVFVLFQAQVSAQTKPFVFAYQNSDNFPYQVGDGNSIHPTNPGVAVEQMKYVMSQLNANVEFHRVPWKRGLLLLKSGDIDGLFSASFKEQRKEFGQYPMQGNQPDRTKRSYSNSYSIFKHVDGEIAWDGERFSGSGYKVFVPLGFSVANDLRRHGINVHEASDILSQLHMLSSQRIDAVALLTPSGQGYLEKHPKLSSVITMVKPPLSTKDYYLMLSHQFVGQHPELAGRIWHELGEVRNSPVFARWFTKYQGRGE